MNQSVTVQVGAAQIAIHPSVASKYRIQPGAKLSERIAILVMVASVRAKNAEARKGGSL